MQGILPEETRTRVKKTGWNAPAHLWFSSGRGREQLRDLVHSRAFRERGLYQVDRVLALVEDHDRVVAGSVPRENHMMFLWQLVNLELWLQSLSNE
jgi:asparagine synthase (glutamine-hydrolysing)